MPSASSDPAIGLFQQALAKFQSGQLHDSEKHLQILLGSDPANAHALHLLGLIAHRQKRHIEAAKLIRDALKHDPGNPAYHCNLGECYRCADQVLAAVTEYRHALTSRPNYPQAHYNLALAYQALGELQHASACYRAAIRYQPNYAKAHNNLANLLKKQGELTQAISHYQQAIIHQPEQPGLHFNLGNALMQMDDLDAAMACYRTALKFHPHHLDALNNLGIALREQGRHTASLEVFTQVLNHHPDHAIALHNMGLLYRDGGHTKMAHSAIAQATHLQPDNAEFLCSLGHVLQDQTELQQAETIWQRALTVNPTCHSARYALCHLYRQQGDIKQAQNTFNTALAANPNDHLLRFSLAALCPTVFSSRSAIATYRQELTAQLTAYGANSVSLPLDKLVQSGCAPPFELPFHGANDLPLKHQYGRIFQKCLPQQTALTPRTGKPHVGLVVTAGHEGLFLKSVLPNLNRFADSRLRYTVVCPAASESALRQQCGRADVAFLPLAPRFSQMLRSLHAATFDLLYYHESGSDALNYFLPFFRLAPVQCTTWGIQVTSGIPNMDYYISSRWSEPEQAEQHYTEKLILLDTLLKPAEQLPQKGIYTTRKDFELPTKQRIYCCPQHLGKLHPDYDATLAEILRRDLNSILLLVVWPSPSDAEKLLQRLQTVMPDVVDRVKILPHQTRANYHQLLQLVDVLLDPYYFCGVNTTYDALALHRAVVTLPGEFQRGRFTLGCMQKMGVLTCVAKSEQEYVDKAIQLATDAAFRQAVERQIAAATPALFGDNHKIAAELEACFWRLIANSRDQ